MVAEVMAPVAVPVEPTTPIKPSEAIRLGCLLAPVQAFGTLGYGGRACVMGAMALGWGNDRGASARAWETGVALKQTKCPVGECGHIGGEGMVNLPAHINDTHRWTRERIADWLAEQGL